MIEEYTKQKNKNTTIKFEASKINVIREKEINMLSCRVFNDGKIFSSNAIGEMNQAELKSIALENPFGAIDYKYDYNANEKISVSGGTGLNEVEVVSTSKALLDEVTAKLPNFLFSGSFDYCEKSYISTTSQGGEYQEETKQIEGFFILKRKGSPNIMDSVLPFNSSKGKIDFANSGFFFDMHNQFDNIVTLENGKHPVMFVMDKGFLGKFQEGLNPAFYHNNACYYAGKLGQKIFNERINISDFRFDEEQGCFHRFDDEGNKLEAKLSLVENGVFKNIFYDENAAQKYNQKCTGNGRREYNMAIRPSAFNLDFESTGETIDETLNKYDKVVVAVLAGGGDTSSNGEFSTPVQVAFLVEKGEVKGRIENLTVGNSIDKMMGDDFISVPKDQMLPMNGKAFVSYMNTF